MSFRLDIGFKVQGLGIKDMNFGLCEVGNEFFVQRFQSEYFFCLQDEI